MGCQGQMQKRTCDQSKMELYIEPTGGSCSICGVVRPYSVRNGAPAAVRLVSASGRDVSDRMPPGSSPIGSPHRSCRWTRNRPRSHEPGDEPGAGDQAEDVARGPEQEHLGEAHRAGYVGRAQGTCSPARRGRRRGRPCTSPVYGTSGGRQARHRTDVRVTAQREDAGLAPAQTAVVDTRPALMAAT